MPTVVTKVTIPHTNQGFVYTPGKTPSGLILAAKKFGGKDTCFNFLQTNLSVPVVNHKWATPLRADLIKMMRAVGVNVTMDDLENQDKKELWVPLLQWYGTDFRRRQDPDYWIKRGLENLEQLRGLYGKVYGRLPMAINTDTRFPNEVEALRDRGYLAIRIAVSPDKQYERAKIHNQAFDEAKRTHKSEVALDGYPGFDVTIDGDLPMDAMLERLQDALEHRGFTFVKPVLRASADRK